MEPAGGVAASPASAFSVVVLPAPLAPISADHFARVDLEVDALDGVDAAVGDPQCRDLEHGVVPAQAISPPR